MLSVLNHFAKCSANVNDPSLAIQWIEFSGSLKLCIVKSGSAQSGSRIISGWSWYAARIRPSDVSAAAAVKSGEIANQKSPDLLLFPMTTLQNTTPKRNANIRRQIAKPKRIATTITRTIRTRQRFTVHSINQSINQRTIQRRISKHYGSMVIRTKFRVKSGVNLEVKSDAIFE